MGALKPGCKYNKPLRASSRRTFTTRRNAGAWQRRERRRTSLATDLFQQRAGRPAGEERDGFEAPAPTKHFGGAHRRCDVVISALDDDIGVTLQNESERRFFVESYHHVHRFQRRENRHPLLERIERPVGAFVQLASRRVGVDTDHQRRAETARVVKVGDMPSMKNIEHAIGEDQGTGERRNACGQNVPRGQLGGERGRRKARQLMYSNTLTTRWTPLVVRAISAAAFPSSGRTMPRR